MCSRNTRKFRLNQAIYERACFGTLTLGLLLYACGVSAETTSMYCPQKHGYINVGMGMSQVMNACGPPTSRQTNKNAVMRKIQVKQLIYNEFNKGSDFSGWDTIYDTWNLPSGTRGLTLTVNIVNKKIKSMNLNGSNVNAATVCYQGGMSVGEQTANQGPMLEIGDSESAVYSACGSPTMVNHTYVKEPIGSNETGENWHYIDSLSQTSFSLTFVNGKLVSIQK